MPARRPIRKPPRWPACRAGREGAFVQPVGMGGDAPRAGAVPDDRHAARRSLRLHPAGPPGRPELQRADDDRGGRLAGRQRAAGAGPGAQPHGARGAATRAHRQRAQLRAPGLWRDDAVDEGRHLGSRAGHGLVPGAQEDRRRAPRIPRRRARPAVQRRVHRRLQRAVCAQRARAALERTAGADRGPQAQAAVGRRRDQGLGHRPPGRAGASRVQQPEADRARPEPSAADRRAGTPERDGTGRLDRRRDGPRVRARRRRLARRARCGRGAGGSGRAAAAAGRRGHGPQRPRRPAELHRAPRRPAGAAAGRDLRQERQHPEAGAGARRAHGCAEGHAAAGCGRGQGGRPAEDRRRIGVGIRTRLSRGAGHRAGGVLRLPRLAHRHRRRRLGAAGAGAGGHRHARRGLGAGPHLAGRADHRARPAGGRRHHRRGDDGGEDGAGLGQACAPPPSPTAAPPSRC